MSHRSVLWALCKLSQQVAGYFEYCMKIEVYVSPIYWYPLEICPVNICLHTVTHVLLSETPLNPFINIFNFNPSKDR